MALSSLLFLWTAMPAAVIIAALARRSRKVQNIILLVLSLLFYAWGDPSHVLLLLISIAVNYALGLAIGGKREGSNRTVGSGISRAAGSGSSRAADLGGSRAADSGAPAPQSAASGYGGAAAGSGSGSASASGRVFLIIAVIFNLGVLGFYKYADFVLNSLDALIPGDLPRVANTLPVGVSFFTFSALTYVIDLYRGKYRAEKDPLALALYISFFPRILSGPIETYEHFKAQLTGDAGLPMTAGAANTSGASGTAGKAAGTGAPGAAGAAAGTGAPGASGAAAGTGAVSTYAPRMTMDTFAAGLRRFLYGLGKKVLIADMCGITVSRIFALDSANLSGAGAWIGMILYTLQLYFDFAGYSDMAIGLAKIFGFTIPENFDYPYLSKSVTEFWRRWHSTLGAWFREYLYIPLGGNRKGLKRTALNLLIVFALTGLWHGASWQFVLWGLYQGIFVVLERLLPVGHKMVPNPKTGQMQRLTLGRALADSKWAGHVVTPLLWCISLVLFRSGTFTEAFEIYKHMFVPTLFLNAGTFLPQMFSLQTFAAMIFGIIGCGPLAVLARSPKLQPAADRWKGSLIEAVYLAVVFALSVLCLAGGTFQAFIYQRF